MQNETKKEAPTLATVKSSMRIMATIHEDGLGLLSWWPPTEEGPPSDDANDGGDGNGEANGNGEEEAT